MTLAKECRHLSRALQALEVTSANERTRDLYEARLKAIRDEWSRIDYGIDKGLKKGLKKGRIEGRVEGRVEGIDEVFSLLEKGISVEEAKKMLSHGSPTQRKGGNL
jgi:hypothetical protein